MPSLRRRVDFLELREKGRFFHFNSWLAVSFKKNNHKKLRWAWTLPKKTGKAVIRNRLKRWGRECLSDFEKKNVDINFIFKNKTREFYKKLQREDFDKTLRKVFKTKIP